MTTRETLVYASAILESILEGDPAGRGVPEGTLYAVLMGQLDLESFGNVIAVLERTGLVSRAGYRLTATAKARAALEPKPVTD